jgi:hypothetical protein
MDGSEILPQNSNGAHYDFIIFNFHPYTMRPAIEPKQVAKLQAKTFAVVLEIEPSNPYAFVDAECFDGLLVLDPTIHSDGKAWPFPGSGSVYKIAGRLYESFSAYERAAELLPGWAEPRREMEALRESVRSRLQANMVGTPLGSSPDAASGQSDALVGRQDSTRPPLHPGANTRRVLWLGSTALASRRERERLSEYGFEVVFRGVIGSSANSGGASRFAKERDLSSAGHTSSSLRETALATRASLVEMQGLIAPRQAS